jgi:hypothetical protein
VQALLDVNDPDWASYNAGDPEYFLRVCGETIRKYCGWHIYPNLEFTKTNLQVGSRGLINLPSLYVTAVNAVTLQGSNAESDVQLNTDQYNWFQNGIIEPVGWQWYGAYSGFYYGPDQWSYLPVYQFGLATVDFNSGYDAVPDVVKEVAYELTTWTQQFKTGGDIKEVASPGFRLALGAKEGGGTGMALNDNQKNRLAPFRIPGVA